MDRYKFPPMLGPASAHPEGTREWAECLGNELEYKVERAEEDGVDDLIPLIRLAISARTKPWTVWPEPPCGSVDAYFLLCTGLTYEQLYVLINTIKADHGLARELDGARAKDEASTTYSGLRSDIGQPPYSVRRLSEKGQDGGNSKSYLLRRIARDAPQVLEAFERGEYKSVRAAADAAGIPRLSRTSRLRSEWKHASPEERAEFLRLIDEMSEEEV